MFYHERGRDESDEICKELRNLDLCSSGLDSPCIFTTEELNSHFSNISSDPAAFSVSEFLNEVADEDYFPHSSFSEVTLPDVKLAMGRPSSQIGGHDGVPQSVICAAFPAIGEFILNIFKSLPDASIACIYIGKISFRTLALNFAPIYTKL